MSRATAISLPPINLTPVEERRLETLEQIVKGSLKGFMAAGEALVEIRDKKLYREISNSFEGYCQIRWNMTRRRADQLIAATNVVAELDATAQAETENPGFSHSGSPTWNPDNANLLPDNEKQARELGKAPEGKRAETWQKAVETAPKGKDGKPKVTAAHVRRVVREETEEHVDDGAQEPAAPDAPEIPLDSVGHKLPDSQAVRDAFAAAGSFRSFKRRLELLKGEFEQMAQGPAGRWASVNLNDFDAQIQSAARVVRHCTPYAVCPVCGGRKCDTCKHTGWLPEDVYELLPPEMKGEPVAGAKGGRAA